MFFAYAIYDHLDHIVRVSYHKDHMKVRVVKSWQKHNGFRKKNRCVFHVKYVKKRLDKI